jgi:hypothetical protein
MAYNVLKGSVQGSVDQHADQEIGGVKVFKNTVSASVFYDTDAQSPCATLKDVAIKKINGATKGGILVYDDENIARASHNLIYDGELLRARRIVSEEYAGSARFLVNLPVDKFNGEIGANFLNYGNGLQNVRGALQPKTAHGICCDEEGLSLYLENDCGLVLKSKKLTMDLTKIEKVNTRGQNLSDDDLLVVSDVSVSATRNTTLGNLYDNYISLKVPHAAGARGQLQLKGNSEFESSANLSFDCDSNTLNLEGRLSSKHINVKKRLNCEGSVHYSIIKTTDRVYQVLESDYTILCDASNNKIKVELPPAVNNRGRVLVIKKTNRDKYKLNSNEVEVSCAEGTIDINNQTTIKMNYSSRTFQSDGENWWIIGTKGS